MNQYKSLDDVRRIIATRRGEKAVDSAVASYLVSRQYAIWLDTKRAEHEASDQSQIPFEEWITATTNLQTGTVPVEVMTDSGIMIINEAVFADVQNHIFTPSDPLPAEIHSVKVVSGFYKEQAAGSIDDIWKDYEQRNSLAQMVEALYGIILANNLTIPTDIQDKIDGVLPLWEQTKAIRAASNAAELGGVTHV